MRWVDLKQADRVHDALQIDRISYSPYVEVEEFWTYAHCALLMKPERSVPFFMETVSLSSL